MLSEHFDYLLNMYVYVFTLSNLVILLNQVEKKAYPSFEAFTIEEEEGSGISSQFLLRFYTDESNPYQNWIEISYFLIQVVMALFTAREERLMEKDLQ